MALPRRTVSSRAVFQRQVAPRFSLLTTASRRRTRFPPRWRTRYPRIAGCWSEGYAPEKLSIAGDSAGGGLTAATLVSIRDQGLPLPASGVCLSPWVDMEGIGDSMTTRADRDPMVQKEGLVGMAGVYLADADPRSPLAAPMYADLSGLPPLLIQVGASETLFDDAVRLDEKARAAGVETTFEEWDDMIHVWHIFAPMLDEGQKAIERMAEFMRQKWDA